jgi:hypothetical protein
MTTQIEHDKTPENFSSFFKKWGFLTAGVCMCAVGFLARTATESYYNGMAPNDANAAYQIGLIIVGLGMLGVQSVIWFLKFPEAKQA